MRVIINETERGLLYKHGVFLRMLEPGRRRVRAAAGESVVRLHADGRLDFPEMNLPALRRHADFEKCVAIVEVPDDRLAVHFTDGRITDMLKPGTYAYWNIYKKHTFEIIDITEPGSAGKLPVLYMLNAPSGYYVQADISDGTVGLLFYNGVFQRTLGSGQHFFWNYNIKVTVHVVDTRLRQLDIPGQEILTADKVSLRINFVCSYRVTDPMSVMAKLKDYKEQLHVLVQLALRELVGKYRFDELLRQKDSIGGFALQKLKEREAEFFVEFTDAGVKDIILPGEIRDIMNTVLVAEKSAQASVITRREEIAATKSLLDTARLMDENATLYKLKELEYIERICEKVGAISLDAGTGILKSLREIVGGENIKEMTQ
ncbi:MAG: slipin family protein [Oscillospiraceae bacterium]|jgi:hypothetical protein|nr:slipin family protein [Oscillospiraceae bacterium]